MRLLLKVRLKFSPNMLQSNQKTGMKSDINKLNVWWVFTSKGKQILHRLLNGTGAINWLHRLQNEENYHDLGILWQYCQQWSQLSSFDLLRLPLLLLNIWFVMDFLVFILFSWISWCFKGQGSDLHWWVVRLFRAAVWRGSDWKLMFDFHLSPTQQNHIFPRIDCYIRQEVPDYLKRKGNSFTLIWDLVNTIPHLLH